MQGVDLSTCDYDRRTPLHVAASEGDLNMVKFLVNVAKVDVDARDRWNRSALERCSILQTHCLCRLFGTCRNVP
ncbi:hypothetical protein V3C99_013172 [Haemonchus contortus]